MDADRSLFPHSLAFGIAKWHKQLEPPGDATVIFRDNAFEYDRT